MSNIFYMFVKNGFLSPDQQNKFFYSYLLGLKKTIFPGGGKEQMLGSQDMIKITWSLVAMQEAGKMNIPLIPKLFEHLASLDRPTEPLSEDELLMLHQINVYIKDLVANDRLPASFLQLFSTEVTDMANAVYQQWDAPLYPEVQKEIAMKLLKLRV